MIIIISLIILPFSLFWLMSPINTIQVSIIGVSSVLICAPIFAIDVQKYYGVDLVPPFGTLCTFVSTVPIWGAFGVVCPLLTYLVPALMSAMLTTLLCLRLMHVAHLEHMRLSEQGIIQVQRNAENGGISGNRSARNSSKQISVSIYK